MMRMSELKKIFSVLVPGVSMVVLIFSFYLLTALNPSGAMAVNAAFDVKKMGDMSDFDPNNPTVVSGDTIRIAVVASISGPAAQAGQRFYFSALWAAHDINKRGG